jgi:cellulose synthase/poly-beta-1,6-N-acetylglucosamine synthase-like glycosyltransferase
MKLIFWISFITIAYTYFIYPLAIYLLSFIFRRLVKKEVLYPTVSILISVYNEEKCIEAKIKSILSLNYPKEKIEILIGSDGSNDRTDEIVRQYVTGYRPQVTGYQLDSERIRFFRHETRQGKPSVLNSLAAQAKNEILVFTDARQRLENDCLKQLVSNFADNSIGSVSAQLIFEDEAGNKGIGLYWNYEKFIRNAESRLGSMLGATGALYAIRKVLFSPLPKDLILDDVYIPLKAVEEKYRAIFEPRAVIYDQMAKNPQGEFLRKIRTLAGNFQIFVLLKNLFNPFKSPVAIQLFSHKFLRLMVPFLLIILFVSNIFILDSILYKSILEAIEKPLIEHILERTEGNQLKAARILGINRNTIRTKIKRLGIVVEKWRKN